jgi:hypothetical protein
MLIGILLALLVVFGCGRSSTPPLGQTEALIKKNVSDEGQRKKALDVVGQMQKEIESMADERRKAGGSLEQLLDKRSTHADELESALQALSAKDQATRDKLLQLRFDLKSVLTAEEWAKVFPAPTTRPSAT